MELRILLAFGVFVLCLWGGHLWMRRLEAVSWIETPLNVMDAHPGTAGRFGSRDGLRFYGRYQVDGRLFGALNLVLPGFPTASGERLVAAWLDDESLKPTVWHHPQQPHLHTLLPPRRHRLPFRFWIAAAGLGACGYIVA